MSGERPPDLVLRLTVPLTDARDEGWRQCFTLVEILGQFGIVFPGREIGEEHFRWAVDRWRGRGVRRGVLRE